MTTLFLKKLNGRPPCRPGCVAILLLLVYFVFSQTAQALLPAPPPDGAYAGGNTAEGSDALFSRTSGTFNTAVGAHALYADTTGTANTAVGGWALAENISGNQNVAIGQRGLDAIMAENNVSFGNVLVGFKALVHSQNSSNFNQAFGFEALYYLEDGMFNDGFGWHALYNNVHGSSNTAMGQEAGLDITGSGNIDIGAGVGGVAGESNITRIRNISTTALNTGTMVLVDSNGKLGHVVSSRRYKEEIKPMDNASEALFALKPVTFRYKGDIDPAHVKMFGLIAEEVAEVNPDLVVRNAKGEVETIRFDSVNAMLLNELLKEQRKVQGMEAIVAQQKKDFETILAQRQKEIKALTASLREQAREIQKVSARLEVSNP
jgi:trimeric autotransporter adhesin